MSNFYIADTHFGHSNIIRFDNRPFSNINEMDEILIKNWNKVVSDGDIVYILGDFSWYKEPETLDILKSLNGNKFLIRGNHDRISPKILKQFVKVCDYLEVNDKGRRVIISHYPMMSWNGQFRDSVHLYGHVHNTKQWEVCEKCKQESLRNEIPTQMYNVGCMMPYMDFTPRTLDEILTTNR